MRTDQFSAAVQIALDQSIDLERYDMAILYGFGLPDFKPVGVLLEVVAKCIRYQVCQFNGGVDNEALEECRQSFRHRVTIVGSDHTITPSIN